MGKGVASSVLLITLVVLPLLIDTTHAIECLLALQYVLPCQGYLIDGDPRPSRECCSGVARLGQIANRSRHERQSVCKCLKSAAQDFPIDVNKARRITRLCNVKVSVPIDPRIDCNKIQ